MKLLTFIAALLFVCVLSTAALAGAHLSWQYNGDISQVVGFRIWKSKLVYRVGTSAWTEIGTTAPNTLVFDDPSGVTGDCYAVSAFNQAGQSMVSNNGCLYPNTPSGESNLSVTPNN